MEYKKVMRYHSKHKKVAQRYASEKNKIAKKNTWKVALTCQNRIIFDIDDFDLKNLKKIIDFYSPLFGEFSVIHTYHGYHLISEKKYEKNSEKWRYDICRVVNPYLEEKDIQKYISQIKEFVRIENEKAKINGYGRVKFLSQFADSFRESVLWNGYGNFDIYFCMNVICRGKYCIRISKKFRDDNPYSLKKY